MRTWGERLMSGNAPFLMSLMRSLRADVVPMAQQHPQSAHTHTIHYYVCMYIQHTVMLPDLSWDENHSKKLFNFTGIGAKPHTSKLNGNFCLSSIVHCGRGIGMALPIHVLIIILFNGWLVSSAGWLSQKLKLIIFNGHSYCVPG